jgi:protein-S-isoprenylcysteine O-methyltransferase Ste14
VVVAPSCTQCHSGEVTLSDVSAANIWLCQECGFTWDENLVSIEGQQHIVGDDATDDRNELTTEETLDPQRLKRKNRIANILLLVVLIYGTVWGLLATWFEPWTPLRVLGLVMFLGGGALVFVARLLLGTAFSVAPRARKLVTTGLYSRIQNPIYLFAAMGGTGLILFLNRPAYFWFVAIQIPIQLFRIKKERKVLTERFGEEYLRYRQHTWF